jgi:hypothetical protein
MHRTRRLEPHCQSNCLDFVAWIYYLHARQIGLDVFLMQDL